MFEHRLRVLLAIIATGFFILGVRLFYLQVVCHADYVEKAADNIAFTEPLPTLRGVIHDRNGITLAGNRVEYEVRVWLSRFEKLSAKDRDHWVRLVADSLNVTPAEVFTAVARAEQSARSIASLRKTPRQQKADLDYIRAYLPQPVFDNVPKPGIIRLQLDEFRLPLYTNRAGRSYPVLDISDSTRRIYPEDSVGANLLGYMNLVNQEEYEKYRDSFDGSALKAYRMDELIGRTGLERYHNRKLRGSRGQRMGVRDVHGRVQQELQVLSPVSGGDVRISIDARLQQLLETALDARLRELERGPGHHGGAAVFMDPNTGDILACATSPRFNPNTVLEDFARLQHDSTGPLFDRARLGLYPLGSVFKVVVALAGLESNTLTGSTEFTCTGAFTIGNKTWRCTRAHGTLRLEQALEQSCNSYFYQAGITVGGRYIHDMALRAGLGARTGLDLSEEGGFVPLPSSQPELINLAIGGGRLQVTPLQAARLMCVFANVGKLPRPRLDLSRPVEAVDLGLDPLKVRVVRWGMYDAVMHPLGTAGAYGRVPGLEYAAKTGTANLDRPNLYDAWYCGFAPFRSPKLAFAAVIEHTQESGGVAAAPVIRDVLTSMQGDPELRRYLIEEASASPEEQSGGEQP